MFVVYFPKGAPTGTAQSCPGWPWGGFKPFAVEIGGAEGRTGACGIGAGVPEVMVGAWAGAEERGAPTWISQR
ncbi:hypothetical protein GCM10027189_29730 [Rufibacter soli]